MVSGATGEETSDACPAESRASGPGDVVSLWAAGPPHQGTDAAGRGDLSTKCIASTIAESDKDNIYLLHFLLSFHQFSEKLSSEI